MITVDNRIICNELDVMVIFQHAETRRFHVALFEWKPLPGVDDGTKIVRLKSKGHHTIGADTLAGAQEQLAELRTKVEIPDTNVVRDLVYPWEGGAEVWTVAPWKGRNFAEVTPGVPPMQPVEKVSGGN